VSMWDGARRLVRWAGPAVFAHASIVSAQAVIVVGLAAASSHALLHTAIFLATTGERSTPRAVMPC
jgi:TPP-dependent pyruvate/acetoin dehydrogenase alpha subunit